MMGGLILTTLLRYCPHTFKLVNTHTELKLFLNTKYTNFQFHFYPPHPLSETRNFSKIIMKPNLQNMIFTAKKDDLVQKMNLVSKI